MFRSLRKIWWLLALCGAADTLSAVMNLFMLNPDGSPRLRTFALSNAVWDMSLLALVAGLCAIVAGLWTFGRGNSWLLSLHGLGLGAFGVIGMSPLVRGPLSFRPISLLFVLMAISAGVFAWGSARAPRTGQDSWLLRALGSSSMAFAIFFLAIGLGWLRLGTPSSYWISMSSYFAFCAIFMLYLALRAHSHGDSPAVRKQPIPAT